MTEFEEVLKTVERCIKYDLLSEKAIMQINEIIIGDLEDKPQLNPDDVDRDLGSSCEDGICPVR